MDSSFPQSRLRFARPPFVLIAPPFQRRKETFAFLEAQRSSLNAGRGQPQSSTCQLRSAFQPRDFPKKSSLRPLQFDVIKAKVLVRQGNFLYNTSRFPASSSSFVIDSSTLPFLLCGEKLDEGWCGGPACTRRGSVCVYVGERKTG